MIKTFLHIVVALALWFGLEQLGLHWGLRLGVVVVGAILVHVAWERLFPNPFLYLGAVPFDADDPLMLEAVARARETFPRFLEIYPDHRTDSMVRFRFETDAGTIENLWADLLEIDQTTARVFVRTLPVDHQGTLDRTMTIDTDRINDWQVEFRDGTLRGGYTNQAMFKIHERERGPLHPRLIEQLGRFRDVDW